MKQLTEVVVYMVSPWGLVGITFATVVLASVTTLALVHILRQSRTKKQVNVRRGRTEASKRLQGAWRILRGQAVAYRLHISPGRIESRDAGPLLVADCFILGDGRGQGILFQASPRPQT